MDEDVERLSREQLSAEIKKLRAGIREHRDSTGQDLCWHHPQLWGLLPERTDPLPAVPAWPEFMEGCVKYRRSLDSAPASGRAVRGTILWRRLDGPGHDACSLVEHDGGWTLEGTAVLLVEGAPASLAYSVSCDRSWRTRSGRVEGRIGTRELRHSVQRAAGGAWLLDGREVSGLEDCVDLDFGFTPSTNLVQLRRLALATGQAADVPVAWLDVETGAIERLDQRYERRSESAYGYESPRFGYAAILDVDPFGFVRRYPGLWEAVE